MIKKLRNSIAFKSIAGMILLLVLFAALVSLAGYEAFNDALYQQYTEGAFRIADAAAREINVDRLGSYYETGGKTADYLQTWEELDQLCNASDATFIYVIRPDRSDYGQIFFIFSTVNRNSIYSPYEVGYVRKTTNDEYRQKYRALCEGESERELLLLNGSGYASQEHHITAMVPLKGSDGLTEAILCVQRQMDAMTEVRNSFVKSVLLILLLLTGIVVIGQGFYLGRVLIRPIRTITAEAIRFSDENRPAERKLVEDITNRDEIGRLAESIDRMEEQVGQYIDNIRRISGEKERIEAELSLAARIQEAMLPHNFPPFPDRHEFELYASMDPAREVGGDFYDFFLIDEDHLCLAIADVSGKGIPAALFMMICKTILQSCAMLGRSASEILTKANEGICSNNKTNMFFTVWIGILEISTGTLTAASAGHEYPVLKQPDGSFALYKDRHGLPVGAMDNARYKEYTLQLEPGTKMFVYTDGVPEASDSENNMLGIGRMIEALNRNPDAGPKELLDNVRQEIDRFVGGAEQFDDITMLAFTYLGTDKRENAETGETGDKKCS